MKVKRTCLNLIKDIYKKPTANIILNAESLDTFLFKWLQGKEVCTHLSYLAQCWEFQPVQ